MNKVKNLRDSLGNLFVQVSERKIDPKDAAAIAGVASKILAACRLEMAYNKQTGNPERTIEFLEP